MDPSSSSRWKGRQKAHGRLPLQQSCFITFPTHFLFLRVALLIISFQSLLLRLSRSCALQGAGFMSWCGLGVCAGQSDSKSVLYSLHSHALRLSYICTMSAPRRLNCLAYVPPMALYFYNIYIPADHCLF